MTATLGATVGGVVVLMVLITLVVAGPNVGSPRPGPVRRRRLGVDPEARLATPGDLAPLWVPHALPGRVVLGHVGRQLVATEDASAPPVRVPRRLAGRARRRRGDRGALMVIGPSRCGKTSALAIPAILEWSGPVVALSVKTDLLAATVAARRRRGEVRVFDPTGATDEPGCTWSPLRAAHRYGAARQSAAALVEATDPHAPGEARFWNDQAVDLLGALMFLAAADGHGMDDLVQWVVTMARPGSATGCPPEMVLQRLEASDDHDLVADARRARRQLTGIWSYEERQFSAVYATARTMVARWDDPVVAASARGPSVDWAWLTDGGASGDRANTLYLCAPLHRPQQLAPVLGGLLADLIEQAYRRPLGTASAPDPVLVVIDEAGNWPVRNLPAVAATAAGVGLQLLVVFQSKAQIDAAYGAQADTLVSNCITKVIFSGVSDPTSATYASALVGDEHVVQHQRTRGPRQGATVSDSTTRLALVAPTVLRQMRPGEALLVHNTLPPAHLRARQWFRDAHLCALAGVAPPRRSPRGRRSPP